MKHPMYKKILSLTLALALALSVAACGGQNSEPSQLSDTSDGAETVPQAAAEPIELVDQIGREVVLDGPAETLVSCYYITTYATVALGLSDRLVGIEKKADTRPIYQMAAPELLELPQVGSMKEFNVEAAAALEPDLVLMPAKIAEYADTLTDLGIDVLVVNPETQDSVEDMLELIAEACGVEENADRLLDYYEEKLDMVEELTEGTEEPLVYMGSNSSYLSTAPGTMYQSDLIDMAGGENVAEDLPGEYWVEVSYEAILNMNPDVIIVPSGAEYTADDILKDAQLAATNAVKNGAVYEMPGELEEWDSPIPSGVIGVLWLTAVLHEDVYPFENFRADVSEYYEEFYGIHIDSSVLTK